MRSSDAARQRWSFLSEIPSVVAKSAPSIWPGFEFQVIDVPAYGTFDKAPIQLSIGQTLGPMKVRSGGIRNVFQDHPTYPQLTLPSDGSTGAWSGAQRGMHLFVSPEAFERTTHMPFRKNVFQRLGGPNRSIEHLLRALYADSASGHLGGPTVGEEIISSILHNICKPEPIRVGYKNASRFSPREIQRVCDVIEAEIHTSLKLERLAALVGMSVRHLCRTFQTTTGLSPHQYILDRRIARAVALIEESRLSLEEIAESVGFSHHSHMTATFRKFVGTTPAQYRQ